MSLSLRLAKAVEELVAASGFRYVRKRNAFARSASHGFDEFLWTVHPTLAGGRSGQQYSLVCAVRHNTVEDAVNQLGLVYGAENQRATATVSCALSYFPLTAGRSYSFFLPDKAAEPEVRSAATEVSDTLEGELLPFFSRYASLSECARGLGGEPLAKSHRLYNNYEPRMYRAVASSYLSGNSSLAEQLEHWQASYPLVMPEAAHAKVAARLEALAGLLGGP